MLPPASPCADAMRGATASSPATTIATETRARTPRMSPPKSPAGMRVWYHQLPRRVKSRSGLSVDSGDRGCRGYAVARLLVDHAETDRLHRRVLLELVVQPLRLLPVAHLAGRHQLELTRGLAAAA